jgi:hypothetical protein
MKPLAREFLLSRGYCCGNKCKNCPYTPKHTKIMWFELIKMLVTIAQHKREVNIEKREAVSKLYSKMSQLLSDTALELSRDIYPQGNCAAMWTLSENLIQYLQDKVNPEELQLLSQLLKECSQLEREFAARQDPDTIKVIFEAAGRLQALSMLYSI